MAPIKFDENIKDKLEKRVLSPSPDAWSNLSSQLDKEDNKGKGKLVMWLGIAASLIGVLLFSTQLFKNGPQSVEPILVEDEPLEINGAEPKNDDLNDPANFKLTTPSQEVLVQNEDSETQVTEKPNTNSNPISAQKQKLKPSVKTNDRESVAINTPIKREIPKATTLNEMDAEAIKVLEVVAEINALAENGDQITDEELDALLKQAERDLLKEKLYNETTKTVDANSLLQDVEDEIDQTFRAKVFDALKNGYDSVRTAVANRNN